MSALTEAVPAGHVVRLCASLESLPSADCAVPQRCLLCQCRRCSRVVHYDPAASIPALGPEYILCDLCAEELLSRDVP